MLEKAPGVLGAYRRKRYSYRTYQSLSRPGRGLAKEVLDLGEGLSQVAPLYLNHRERARKHWLRHRSRGGT